jgi:glycosyltransferase involved in cell wall biosynthesis
LLVQKVALLISLYFPPEQNGGSTGAWNRALALHKLGFTVFVLCGFPTFPTGKITDTKYKGKFFYLEDLEPVKTIRVRILPLGHRGFVSRFFLYSSFIAMIIIYWPLVRLKTGKISLVYARAPILFSSIPGFFYSKLTRSFYIYEVPDLWPEELAVFRSPFLPAIMRIGIIMSKVSYSSADILITVSSLAKEYIKQNYRPSCPIFGIPVGVDPSKFGHVEKSTALEQLMQENIIPDEFRNKFIVLYSGLISPAQNVEVLAHAAKQLQTNNQIIFLIVGEGEEREKIEQMVIGNKLNNFFMIPRQPRHVMPKIIAIADICTVILSSDPIFEIAIPTKFYEYLASYKPILGLCRGELANIIISKGIGHIVQQNGNIDGIVEAIISIKNSHREQMRLQENCKTSLKEFSIDSVALQLKDILLKHSSVFAN